MRKKTSGIRIVSATMGALLWAGTVAADDPSPRCVAAMDRTAGIYSRCLLQVQSIFARDENQSRMEARSEQCAERFGYSVEKIFARYGEENCTPVSLAEEIEFDVTQTAAQVALQAAGDGKKPAAHCLTPQSMAPFECVAPWIFCIDGLCSDETIFVNGHEVSECQCWSQTSANSIMPTSYGGAACVMGYPGGPTMCDQMQNEGALYSTFVPSGGAVPPIETAQCAPKTRFAYCWGAKCRPCVEADDCKEGSDVVCDCPVISTERKDEHGEALPQDITLTQTACAEEKLGGGSPCDHIHNSNPPGLSPTDRDSPALCYPEGG